VEVVGVYARDAARRAAFSTAHGIPAAASAEALIADPRTRAILLLTPPDARLVHVRSAVALGKAVLVEKPVGRTTAEAEAMVALARAAGVPMGVVLQHRKRRGALDLRRLLTDGVLGRIGLVRLVVPWWRDQAYYDAPGRGTIARDGGGVLLSQAIHAIDLMLHLAGPVARVSAFAGTSSLHRMETEDVAVAGLEFASGAIGALVATTAAFPGGSEVLSVDGDRGSAELAHGELVVRWRDGRVDRSPDSIASGSGADPMAFDHAMHREVIREFVAAVAAGRDAPVTAGDGLAAQRLIDAMLASSREGRRIDVART
jgi:predicted dehydrogenase